MKTLHRSWDILSQHLPKASLPLIFLLTTPNLQAIHDTNHNGVSDLWEEKFNSGALYLTFNPTADPDADGWTNAQEAAAGTDPTTGVGPTGYVRPKITHTPAVYLSPEEEGGQSELDTPEVMTITWPTVAGKKYTLLFSTDLTAGNWTAIGDPRIGAGTEIGTSIPLTQPDGTTPGALFWRVTIVDIDTDSDTLTNAEEAQLGSNPSSADGDGDGLSDVDELFVHHTNPSSPDTDGDGVYDSQEIASGHNPQSNQSYPPRLNIALRSASTGASNAKGSLYSNWPPYFFQEIQRSDTGVSTLPTRVATMPFPDQAPDNLLRAHQKGSSWDGAAPFYGLVQDASDGMLTQSRYWLQTKPVSNVEIKRTFLKVTTCYRMTYSPLTEVFPPIVEKLEVTIPANSTASLPIDIMPPLNFPPGFYTSIGNRVTLLPVDLMDIKDSAKTDDDVTITPWDKATQPNPRDENIAWIEPHKSATDPAPRMPQLELRINGLLITTTIQAKIEVQYNRGNGARAARNQAEDRVRIPADGSFQTVTGDTWKIWEAYANETFFGGEATLTYKLMTGATETLAPQTIKFRIGGKNPTPARAKTYIESLPNAGPQGNLWFSYAIAKSESQDYNSNGTRYNQFLRLPQNPVDNSRPLFGDDRNEDGTPNGPGGYGMFQVTVATVNIPRQQIWNWQENATGGLAIITSKWTLATNWMTNQRNQALQQRGQVVPVGSRTEAAVTFAEETARVIEHAVTIKAYNGASRGHYCAWNDAGQGAWKFNLLNNLNFNYTNRVCTEVEP